jgi:3-oxoacyl-[acyl-carrier-protein] synthase-3
VRVSTGRAGAGRVDTGHTNRAHLGSDIYVATSTTWLPERTDAVRDAVRRGALDEKTAARNGYLGLTVAGGVAPPDMAVYAARTALSRANWHVDDVGVVAHAWIHHQGHDFWSPAHYVAARIGADSAIPVGVQQMCNGGAAAVDIGVARMLADDDVTSVLVTTADRFDESALDRWSADYGVCYGDGGTALLLRRGAGRFRLLSTATVAASELERMHRGDDEFSPVPRWHSDRIDVRRTKKAFLVAEGDEKFAVTAAEGVARVVRRALDDAGVPSDCPRLKLICLPRLGRAVLDTAYLPALVDLRAAEILDLGRHTGHLGAGDSLANLAEIEDLGLLATGELALIIGAGGGFTWSALVVEAC